MKTVTCPANKSTTIISNFGSGFPRTFEVTIRGAADSEVTGDYIEKRCFWIFPQSPVQGKLAARMQFHRYWINAIYSVSITPDQDVTVEIR